MFVYKGDPLQAIVFINPTLHGTCPMKVFQFLHEDDQALGVIDDCGELKREADRDI